MKCDRPNLRCISPDSKPLHHNKDVGYLLMESIVESRFLFLCLASILPLVCNQNASMAFPDIPQISEPSSDPSYVGVEGFEAAIDVNSIQWEQPYLKVVTVSTEYEALVIYDCQNYRSAELMLGDGTGEMRPVQESVWNNRDPSFARAVCDTATEN